jgi:DNA (cytosine-5)-methyltransferase 1
MRKRSKPAKKVVPAVARKKRSVVREAEQLYLIRQSVNGANGKSTTVRRLHFIDLFAGCGGLSLGLEEAGFDPVLFSEINPDAAETYIANRVGMNVIPVGDVYTLTDDNINLLKTYWRHQGIADIDLVCGGPPCQGFSGIGHRRSFDIAKKDIPSNHLFEEMVRVIRCVNPKAFLFENVRGLLYSRWTHGGEKGEVFEAVLAAFNSLKGYAITWDLLHAKDYGVPQNRPRVVLIGVRTDVLPVTAEQPGEPASSQLGNAIRLGYLPAAIGKPPTLEELLSDLEDPNFLSHRSTTTYPREPANTIQIELRTTRDGKLLGKGEPLTEHEYSKHSARIREKFQSMIANGGTIPEKFKTKKFAQRVFPLVWDAEGPNLTAASLPDDYVHYRQPRAPTVREWARLQTFPDWYVFKGSRTTGGRRRAGDPSAGIWKRDVPRFTQIGNAVPVWLAKVIGIHLRTKFLLPNSGLTGFQQ